MDFFYDLVEKSSGELINLRFWSLAGSFVAQDTRQSATPRNETYWESKSNHNKYIIYDF